LSATPHRCARVHRHKEFTMKRIITLAMLGLFSVSMLSACNTMAGAGQDVQKAGEKLEDKAQDCKDGRC